MLVGDGFAQAVFAWRARGSALMISRLHGSDRVLGTAGKEQFWPLAGWLGARCLWRSNLWL